MPTKTLMERRIQKFSENDRLFAEEFCLKTRIRRETRLQEWLAARMERYCLDSNSLREGEASELAEGARLYRFLFEKPFEPQSFVYRSLSADTVALLTFEFGSREAFREAVAHTRWNTANRDFQYAAWVFGFIDTKTLYAIPVSLYTRVFPPNKKWRR